jgi:hypothetical protein
MEYVWEEDTRESQGEWGVYYIVQDMQNKLDDEDVELMARKLWLRQNMVIYGGGGGGGGGSFCHPSQLVDFKNVNANMYDRGVLGK